MQSNQVDRSKYPGGLITGVMPGSIGKELGITPGDKLLSIDGQPLIDILDYRYLIADEELEVVISRGDQELHFELEKDYDEDLGLEFEDVLFDQIRRCKNNCDFCFIYQLPKKMRRSLYVKDDDYRLSFLYGNYVTLAGLKDEDYDRIIRYHLSPLYVSVHASDLSQRRKLLRNERAEDIIERLQFLISHGIEVYTQAVIVPGLNDGETLRKTMVDIAQLYPGVRALGVVPVGLTQYQSRLKRLNPHTQEEARECIRMIETQQKEFLTSMETPFVQVADEFYLKANLPFPSEEHYDHYDLLENGIGTARQMVDDFFEHYNPKEVPPEKTIGIITGEDGGFIFQEYILPFLQPEHRSKIKVFPIKNNHFGESVTVSGLITGGDLIAQLKTGECNHYFLPDNCLKFDQPVFLDDMDISSVQTHLNATLEAIAPTGQDLVEAIFSA